MRKVDKYENVNDESFKRVLGLKRSTYGEKERTQDRRKKA